MFSNLIAIARLPTEINSFCNLPPSPTMPVILLFNHTKLLKLPSFQFAKLMFEYFNINHSLGSKWALSNYSVKTLWSLGIFTYHEETKGSPLNLGQWSNPVQVVGTKW